MWLCLAVFSGLLTVQLLNLQERAHIIIRVTSISALVEREDLKNLEFFSGCVSPRAGFGASTKSKECIVVNFME